MFSNLRQGSLFYILQKGEKPELKIGQVISVTNPVPRYNNSYAPINQLNHDMIMDVTVKVGDKEMNFKQLPCSQSISTFETEGIIVSESRDAMNAEVEAMLRTSQQIIDNIPFHESVVASCDSILRELNPRFAKEKEQEEKIDTLEKEICSIKDVLGDVKGMLSKALNVGINNPKNKQL